MDVVLEAVPALPKLYRDAVFAGIRPGRQGNSRGLPDVHHSVAGVAPSAGQLTRFQQLLGQPARDFLPSGFVHTIAFPVAMSVMARPDFPLPLLGMIHVRNSVEHRRCIHFLERLDISSWAENIRPHSAGTQVDLVTEVTAGGESVWTGRSTYLAKGAGTPEKVAGKPGERTEPQPGHADFTPPQPSAVWTLDGGTGRSYAAVSGDYNPIHLSALTARALGMKRAIAHGMYLGSRMVEEAKPAGVESFSWSIDFRTPVLLPGRVAVVVEQRGTPGGWQESEVTAWDPRRRRPHFDATVSRLRNPE